MNPQENGNDFLVECHASDVRISPMPKTPEERAKEVAEMPHVKRWIKRFHRLAKEMPDEIHVYVANGTPTVMVRDEDGQSYSNQRGQNRAAIIEILGDVFGWDGGDW